MSMVNGVTPLTPKYCSRFDTYCIEIFCSQEHLSVSKVTVHGNSYHALIIALHTAPAWS